MRSSQSAESPPPSSAHSGSPPRLKESAAYLEVDRVPRLQWESRWLRGHEYGLMLRRMEDYCVKFGLERYPLNQHPVWIYQRPQNGGLYFMHGSSLQRFGFPRIDRKKKYCWKKMNFVTNLPKSHPQISYIVASSYLSSALFGAAFQEYRMHVVVLADASVPFLICHVRRIAGRDGEQKECFLRECFDGTNINFYRLFINLHNRFNHLEKQ